MKNHLLLSAAAGALLIVAAPAFAADTIADTAPIATNEAPAETSVVDAIIVIGQGQSRQVQTLNNEAIGLQAAGTSALKAIRHQRPEGDRQAAGRDLPIGRRLRRL